VSCLFSGYGVLMGWEGGQLIVALRERERVGEGVVFDGIY